MGQTKEFRLTWRRRPVLAVNTELKPGAELIRHLGLRKTTPSNHIHHINIYRRNNTFLWLQIINFIETVQVRIRNIIVLLSFLILIKNPWQLTIFCVFYWWLFFSHLRQDSNSTNIYRQSVRSLTRDPNTRSGYSQQNTDLYYCLLYAF